MSAYSPVNLRVYGCFSDLTPRRRQRSRTTVADKNGAAIIGLTLPNAAADPQTVGAQPYCGVAADGVIPKLVELCDRSFCHSVCL